MGDAPMVDTMIKDGRGMPSTATTWGTPRRTSRSVADHRDSRNQSAVASQNKAERRRRRAAQDEIVPVAIKTRRAMCSSTATSIPSTANDLER